MKRITVLLLLIAALVSGCSSAPQAKLAEPAFRVHQIEGEVPTSQQIFNPIDITLRVEIENRSAEPLVLKRISMSSVGGGSYALEPRAQTYDVTIPALEKRSVTIWVRAYAESRQVAITTPITARGAVIFETPYGKMRNTFIENVYVTGRRN